MHKRVLNVIRILVLPTILTLLFSSTQPALGASFVVNSTGDEPDSNPGDTICTTLGGVCTLRAAIEEANSSSGSQDTITFNLPGDLPVPRFITINSELPAITTPTTIQGPNSDGATIFLEGDDGDYNGLVISASNCVVRGLNIRGFGKNGIYVNGTSPITGVVVAGNYLGTTSSSSTIPGNGMNGIHLKNVGSSVIGGDTAADRNIISKNGENGILIEGGGPNLVLGNFIGTDQTGTSARANSENGININDSEGNTIGGNTPAERNLISGNMSDGIEIAADQNYVMGNYIGTDITGGLAIPNVASGVKVFGKSDQRCLGNQIGGTLPGEGNLISGNLGSGIIFGYADSTLVYGNIIGLSANQAWFVPNLGEGISIASSSYNVIGGTAAGSGNVITGNYGSGINLFSADSAYNIIQGNRIGINASGVGVPNGSSGIAIQDAHHTTVGGIENGAGNIIAYNKRDGVTMYWLTYSNSVIGNVIYDNEELGIDLRVAEDPASGVTPNDDGDLDTGPNNYQNFPILTDIEYTSTTSVTIEGNLNSLANSSFTIHFYGNDSCDPSGHGEGQVYLGSTNIKTDSEGNATISRVLTVAQKYMYITATATDASDNTSEFSACRSAGIIYLPLILR